MFSFIKNKVYLFTRMYFKRAKNIKQIDKFKLTFRLSNPYLGLKAL